MNYCVYVELEVLKKQRDEARAQLAAAQARIAELERQFAEQRRRADEAEEMREKLGRAVWHLAYEDARRRGFGPGAGRLAGDAVNAALAETAGWRDTPAKPRC